MRYIKLAIFLLLSLLFTTSCDLLLGPIGPLSQIHKSLSTPWVISTDLYSTGTTGWADNAKVQIVERGGSTLVVYGVQYSATSQQDIKYYTSLTVDIPQSHLVVDGSATMDGMLKNVFDVSVDASPAIIYRHNSVLSTTSNRVFYIATGAAGDFVNTNFLGYNLFYPNSGAQAIGEQWASLYYFDNGTPYNWSMIVSPPAVTNVLDAMKNEYLNSKIYFSYISRDQNGGTNYLSVHETTLSNTKVNNFLLMSQVWNTFKRGSYDVAFDEAENVYVAVDGGLFVSDGGTGLMPLDSSMNPITTSNAVALFVKNNSIHMVNQEGYGLVYSLRDAGTGNIILEEPLTNMYLSGEVVDIDIYVDSLNMVYIGILEYRGTENKTFGHLMRR